MGERRRSHQHSSCQPCHPIVGMTFPSQGRRHVVGLPLPALRPQGFPAPRGPPRQTPARPPPPRAAGGALGVQQRPGRVPGADAGRRAARHRRGARRQPLVHGTSREQDRQDHHVRGRHRVRRPDRLQFALRHHGRAGRPLVHRVGRGQDRRGHHLGVLHGVRPARRCRAAPDHGRPGRTLVRGPRQQQDRQHLRIGDGHRVPAACRLQRPGGRRRRPRRQRVVLELQHLRRELRHRQDHPGRGRHRVLQQSRSTARSTTSSSVPTRACGSAARSPGSSPA